MKQSNQSARDYEVVEKAILFIEENFRSQPSLKQVASSVHLSEFHFQKIFRRWAGVSPKKFLQFLSKEYAKECLDSSASVLDTAYEVGLSGSSRLHDLFVNIEGVTPGEYKKLGKDLDIFYGTHPSVFGECFLAITERGICEMHFDLANPVALLNSRWPQANIKNDQKRALQVMNKVFSKKQQSLQLYAKGTNFQLKVWEALLRIPLGSVVSYSDMAHLLEKPNGARAVASAIAQNSIAFLIPCHRVIRKAGNFSDYRWGKVRKKAMLAWEMSQ